MKKWHAGAAAIALLFAATGAAAGADAPSPDTGAPPMHDLFHYPPVDDEVSGAYDRASGLGTWSDCVDEGGTPVLTVQFSYSGRTGPLTFVADLVPDIGRHLVARPAIHHVLTPQQPIWNYTQKIASCDDRYVIFVGYPKPDR